MLKSILLVNFQKHKNLSLDFANVTCISGKTNAGKSSILRALFWVTLNKPSGGGAAFLRHGEKEVSATIQIDNHTITRFWSKSKNTYSLDGKEFAAFGTGVPEPIAKILQVDLVNHSLQLDQHYWFHLTPGECAKELNRIVSLDRIDEVTANIASVLRKAKSEAEVSEKRLTEARAKRDETAWTIEAEGELKEVETKYNELVKISQDASGLHEMMQVIGEAKEQARIASGAILNAGMAVQKAEEWADLTKRREGLGKVLQNATLAREEWGSVGERLAAVQSELAEVKSCPLCGSLFDSKTAKQHTLCTK